MKPRPPRSTRVRSSAASDVYKRQPGYDASGYFGFGAPKSTPTDIIDKLNKEIKASVVDPPVKEKLVTLGIEPMQLTPAEYGKLIADETEKWAKVVKAAGMKME